MSDNMQNKDFRSDLEHWMDIWDQSQNEEGAQPAVEKVQPAPYSGDSAQDDYYDYLGSEELFQEQKVMNPVPLDSFGKDSDSPDPAWVSEELLKGIEKLKDKLFKVENEVARLGQGKTFMEKPLAMNGQKLMTQIESIRKEIDRVSNELGIKGEPSPWETKKS